MTIKGIFLTFGLCFFMGVLTLIFIIFKVPPYTIGLFAEILFYFSLFFTFFTFFTFLGIFFRNLFANRTLLNFFIHNSVRQAGIFSFIICIVFYLFHISAFSFFSLFLLLLIGFFIEFLTVNFKK